MGRKNKSSGQKMAKQKAISDHVYNVGDRVTKDGLDLSRYRFSATNMMLGLDSMIPTSKTKKLLTKKAEARGRKHSDTSTQTDEEPVAPYASGALPVGPSTEPESTSAETVQVPAPESDTQSSMSDSIAESASHTESSSCAESSPCSEELKECEVANRGDEASSQDASTDVETLASAEAPSKSVTFAEGTNAAAASPPNLGGPFMPISTTGIVDWTMSEDAMIVSMKEQGASWALIANSIKRTKAQVRKRYYELKINQAHETANHDEAVRIWNENLAQEADTGAASQSETDSAASGSTITNESGDDFAPVNEWEVEESSLGFGEAEDDQASSADLHLDSLREDESDSSSATDDDDGYDASDYDPFADPADPIAEERYRRRVERYMARRHHAALFPGGCSVRDALVDQGFSRGDRALLEAIRDRHTGRKWLEMQANFFNVTGRMIPLHLIKAKCDNNSPGEGDIGYLARGERKVANWTEAVAYGAELLDPAEAKERPVDALSDSDSESESNSASNEW